jgi:membrane protease subunit HflC
MRFNLNKIAGALLVLLLVFWLLSNMLFQVDQRQYALVFSSGVIKSVLTKPGLYFKLPPPAQSVTMIDRRIQTVDNDDSDRYVTADKKNLMVNLLLKWQVADPRAYYLAFKGDRASAAARLSQMARSALSDDFAAKNVNQVVSNQRDAAMLAAIAKVSADADKQYGINVIDIRVKRVDLLPEVTDAVYRRMQAERTQQANALRSIGSAEAEQIKADADRQRRVILADAKEKAQGIMGDGDAQASQIYAEAFGRDPAFYAFYQSLEAYKASFRDRRDVLVLDPSGDFFKYLKNPEPSASPPARR